MNNNYGNSSLRFSFEDSEQKLAYDFLQKVSRKQTTLITTLICEYLEKNNINPYLYDSDDLNNMVKAYCKARQKSKASANLPLNPIVIAETVSEKPAKPIKKKKEVKKENLADNKEILETKKIETHITEVEEEININDIDEIDITDDFDDSEISAKDIANAMSSLIDFM